MKIINDTGINVEKLNEFAGGHNTENLLVFVKCTKNNAKIPYSGVCYYKDNRIRISINPKNRYPIRIRVGSPFDKNSWNYYPMKSANDLINFVFLHEFSHYLDYRNGIPVRCKQTKADKFALRRMGLLK